MRRQAPVAVSWPVRRLALGLAALAAALGLVWVVLGGWFWHLAADAVAGWRWRLALGAVLGVAGSVSALHWAWRLPTGRLHWNGAGEWRFDPDDPARPQWRCARLSVVLDAQSHLLLRRDARQECPVGSEGARGGMRGPINSWAPDWMWLDATALAAPQAATLWADLRRAVYFRGASAWPGRTQDDPAWTAAAQAAAPEDLTQPQLDLRPDSPPNLRPIPLTDLQPSNPQPSNPQLVLSTQPTPPISPTAVPPNPIYSPSSKTATPPAT